MTEYEIKQAEFTANILKLIQSVSEKIMIQDPSIDEQQAWLFAKQLVFKSYESILGAIEYQNVSNYANKKYSQEATK